MRPIRPARRPAAAAIALPLALAMSGCVVDEINEGIATSNENVRQTNQDLDVVTGRMAEINTRLDGINAELDEINGQLAILTSIDASLKKLDVHLASLRKTINNIDSTIPFLRLSGDDEDDKDELEAGDQAGEGAEAPEPQK